MVRVASGEQGDPRGERARERDVGVVEARAALGERGQMGRGARVEPVGTERVGGEHEHVGAVARRPGGRGRHRDDQAQGDQGCACAGSSAGSHPTETREAGGERRPSRRRSGDEGQGGQHREHDDAACAQDVGHEHLDGASGGPVRVPGVHIERRVPGHPPQLERGVERHDHREPPHRLARDAASRGALAQGVPQRQQAPRRAPDERADRQSGRDDGHADPGDLPAEASAHERLELLGLSPARALVDRGVAGRPRREAEHVDRPEQRRVRQGARQGEQALHRLELCAIAGSSVGGALLRGSKVSSAWAGRGTGSGIRKQSHHGCGCTRMRPSA